jgi:alpha-beta hydrolase superfamily lysophospholipase
MRKKLTYTFLILFILVLGLLNYVANNHAYNFTHYASINEDSLKVRDESRISVNKKLQYLVLGVPVPRPENISQPSFDFTTAFIQTPKGKIEVWEHATPMPQGTIIMFHGYSNKKSSLIKRANRFIHLGYSVMLVDFLGSGGSEGNFVTIGYQEAEQVKYCFEYAHRENDQPIYLFGISMGAVSIMKCMDDHQLPVKGIILECPFGTLRKTLKNRFNDFGVPAFPMLDLLMIWGSYQMGYWTYSHNPVDYAKNIHCPTLLMHGNWDPGVSKSEIDLIFKNLKGKKTLKRFLFTGHDIFTGKNYKEWNTSVDSFMIETGSKDPVRDLYFNQSD